LGGFMVATRSGDFQLGLMLAALAVLVLPSAAEAYTPEGDKRVQATRFACAAPRFRTSTASGPACTGTRRSLVLAAGSSSVPGHTGRRRATAEGQAEWRALRSLLSPQASAANYIQKLPKGVMRRWPRSGAPRPPRGKLPKLLPCQDRGVSPKTDRLRAVFVCRIAKPAICLAIAGEQAQPDRQVRACQKLKNLYYRPPSLRSAARCASRARKF
jgi:hypothetical protein